MKTERELRHDADEKADELNKILSDLDDFLDELSDSIDDSRKTGVGHIMLRQSIAYGMLKSAHIAGKQACDILRNNNMPAILKAGAAGDDLMFVNVLETDKDDSDIR